MVFSYNTMKSNGHIAFILPHCSPAAPAITEPLTFEKPAVTNHYTIGTWPGPSSDGDRG